MASLVTFAAPAVEPLTIAEVMAHLRLDAGNQEPPAPAPLAALVSPAAAGNVDNGTHRYLVVFVTATGKTQAGTPSAVVTVVNKTINGKVALTDIPLGGSAVTAREIYRTVANGSAYLLLATLADNSTTVYTDNIADASLGAGAPSVNTTTDPMLAFFIGTARQRCENEIGCCLITQTLDLTLESFPCGVLEVPRGPLQQVVAITYTDPDGVVQTLAADQYQVDATHERGIIAPAYGTSWPCTRLQPGAVKVRYIAGFGNTAAAVPLPLRQWMQLQIGDWYENRAIVGNIVTEMPYVAALLDAYRVTRF
ncbi:MAG: hypothetical protein H6R18_1939 [Proteobacteria bacterium]|nr:hypothetical protein [Pseudomonadota bacterium]